jgi:hypothetical protein
MALESAAKGAMSIAGVLAVAATMESHWISDRVDTVLDPDRDENLGRLHANFSITVSTTWNQRFRALSRK